MVANSVAAVLHILGYSIVTPWGAAAAAVALLLGGYKAIDKLTGGKVL